MTEDLSFQQRVDKHDLAKAERKRDEYGQVKWLVSWHMANDDEWLARVSTPRIDETFEGTGLSRCDAIDAATRKVLAALHEMSKQEQETA